MRAYKEIRMTAFVVLHYNYGDQGVAFHGVFNTYELALSYIEEKESDKHEQQSWDILEEQVNYE